MKPRRKPGRLTIRDPDQWYRETYEADRADAHRLMTELNASPTSALVRELADTLYFERYPEKRN